MSERCGRCTAFLPAPVPPVGGCGLPAGPGARGSIVQEEGGHAVAVTTGDAGEGLAGSAPANTVIDVGQDHGQGRRP